MDVTEELIRHVAGLAKLSLSEEEVSLFREDFEEVLSAFSVLSEAVVEGVVPTFHSVSSSGLLREDVVSPGLSQEEALLFTTDSEEGLFVGPKSL
ncbi:MAG: Asp-tRNA(Asn)/Glu-tRNA(Gln) amidotransferase subunit GatC [Candidatus Woesearchaeota archaeon]